MLAGEHLLGRWGSVASMTLGQVIREGQIKQGRVRVLA